MHSLYSKPGVNQQTQQQHDYVEYHGFGVSYTISRPSLTLSTVRKMISY